MSDLTIGFGPSDGELTVSFGEEDLTLQMGESTNVANEAADAALAALAETQALFDEAEDILPKLTGPEANGGAIFRVLWGVRELARFTKLAGWLFQRLTLKASATWLDDSTLVPLLKDRVLTPTGPEVGSFGRHIVGNRLFYDITLARGFYPRRATLPADTKVDDDLETTLADRLNSTQNGGRSGPDISQYGDSLTQQMGSALATATGRTVHNLGVGGETSREIFGRAGTTPFLVSVSGGSIPTSGPVNVTLASSDSSDSVVPLQQGSAGINPCSLAGVAGTLTYSSGNFVFTRTTAGSAVSVPYPKPLITDAFNNNRDDIAIIEAVQNGSDTIDVIIARINAFISNMTRPVNLWLVAGWTTGTMTTRATAHARLQAEYGRRFINNLEWLSNPASLAHAGITATGPDVTAQSSGATPPSFLADPIHLNTAGYAEKAYYETLRLTELGMI